MANDLKYFSFREGKHIYLEDFHLEISTLFNKCHFTKPKGVAADAEGYYHVYDEEGRHHKIFTSSTALEIQCCKIDGRVVESENLSSDEGLMAQIKQAVDEVTP